MDFKWIVIIALVWFVYANWKEAKVTNSMIAAGRKEDERKQRYIRALEDALGSRDIDALREVETRCKDEWTEAERSHRGNTSSKAVT